MTSCLLIVPHFISGKRSIFGAFEYTMPPIGLLSIAACLRQNGVFVQIMDLSVELNKNNTIDTLLTGFKNINGNPQWIGISVCTPAAYTAYKIANNCKKHFPDAKIVMGGPHITVLGYDVFDECANVDYLVLGEGEYAMMDLIVHQNDNNNAILKPGAKNNVNKAFFDVDLTTLPMPAYDLLKLNLYTPPPSTLKRKKNTIGIIASRGCPYHCTFCVKTGGHKLKYHSVAQVISQIKYLTSTFNIEHFNFYDDTITYNYNFIKELCNAIIDERLHIQWSCFARVDTIDEEKLHLLKKAGCIVVMYGIESFDEKVLKSIRKNITTAQIKKALELTHDAGLESRVSVMIGNPEDTMKSIEKTRLELKKLNADYLQVFIAIPMPGSEFYINALKENKLKTKNWNNYNLSKVIYQHPIFTEKELFKIQKKYYQTFYLRYKYIYKMLIKIDSPNAFFELFKGFWGLYKILLSK